MARSFSEKAFMFVSVESKESHVTSQKADDKLVVEVGRGMNWWCGLLLCGKLKFGLALVGEDDL